MYLVYTRRNEKLEIMPVPRMIAIYARKQGAIERAKELSPQTPGVTFYVGVLPEGAAPSPDNCKAVDYIAMYSPATGNLALGYEANVQDNQAPTDDLPF